MSLTTLLIDIAKNVFHVYGGDAAEKAGFQKRFSWVALIKFMARRREYNDEPPKAALGGLTLAAYARQLARKSGTVASGLQT
ncbi:MAG: hypothetical protein GDA65_12940 [Nitrospira sp. CR1.1]|nr:hypothetical protein [Nitrospira sp. CR1.1]